MAFFRRTLPSMDANGVQTLGEQDARGAQRVGLIWVLVISTLLAAAVVFGLWMYNSGRMNSAQQEINAREPAAAARFDAPEPPSPTPPAR